MTQLPIMDAKRSTEAPVLQIAQSSSSEESLAQMKTIEDDFTAVYNKLKGCTPEEAVTILSQDIPTLESAVNFLCHPDRGLQNQKVGSIFSEIEFVAKVRVLTFSIYVRLMLSCC